MLTNAELIAKAKSSRKELVEMGFEHLSSCVSGITSQMVFVNYEKKVKAIIAPRFNNEIRFQPMN